MVSLKVIHLTVITVSSTMFGVFLTEFGASLAFGIIADPGASSSLSYVNGMYAGMVIAILCMFGMVFIFLPLNYLIKTLTESKGSVQ